MECSPKDEKEFWWNLLEAFFSEYSENLFFLFQGFSKCLPRTKIYDSLFKNILFLNVDTSNKNFRQTENSWEYDIIKYKKDMK